MFVGLLAATDAGVCIHMDSALEVKESIVFHKLLRDLHPPDPTNVTERADVCKCIGMYWHCHSNVWTGT